MVATLGLSVLCIVISCFGMWYQITRPLPVAKSPKQKVEISRDQRVKRWIGWCIVYGPGVVVLMAGSETGFILWLAIMPLVGWAQAAMTPETHARVESKAAEVCMMALKAPSLLPAALMRSVASRRATTPLRDEQETAAPTSLTGKRVSELEARVAELEALVRKLTERVAVSSPSTDLPPASDLAERSRKQVI